MKPLRPLLFAGCALALGLSSLPAHAAPGTSAPALFNEANAELRAGHPGPAILHYEQARLLAPRDPAVAQNLRVARTRAGVSDPAVAAWQRPARALSLNALALLGSICLLLLCVLLCGNRLLSTTVRSLSRGLAAALGTVLILAIGCLAQRWPELSRAVILPEHTTAHLAPAANAEGVFELKGGEIVCLRGEHGDFARVGLADGRAGWVNKSGIERIVPGAVNPSRL